MKIKEDATTLISANNNTASRISTSTLIKPLIFLHGIGGYASEFYPVMEMIRKEFNNQSDTTAADVPIMHSLNIREGQASLLTPMLTQRDEMVQYLIDNAAVLGIDKDGFHFVGHSQGALLARSVIQKLPRSLKVHTYISMAGPQRGQWGPCDMNIPNMTKEIYSMMARSVGWWAFYNPIAQRKLSFANYWNDPRHRHRFERNCNFLPSVNGYNTTTSTGAPNNMVDGDMRPNNDDMPQQRANFLRLDKAVFLGSAADDCINPPLTSVFEFVDVEDRPLSFNQSWEYQGDTFGLRTMLTEGRLFVKKVPNLRHMSWLEPAIFKQHVLPYLLSSRKQ